MTVENPCRIIFVSREDMLVWNSICLAIRQLIGVELSVLSLLFKGQFKNAFSMLLGAAEGFACSIARIAWKGLITGKRGIYV